MVTSINPEFRAYASAEFAFTRERYRTRAERFRAAAAEAHAQWRLGCVGVRHDHWREVTVFKEGLREIVRLSLTRSFLPNILAIDLAQRKILNDFDKIAALGSNRDPYAPRRAPGEQLQSTSTRR